MKLYRNFGKRIIDIVVSGSALLILSVPLAAITIWLQFANKGAGAFFSQKRPGKDEKIFKLYKFKSMTDKRDEAGKLLPDAQRITRAGRFVRKTSIDELPQLWNVLIGDMSLIGPRPLLVRYLGYYTETERLRHTVRPGITGLAQVRGRNHLTWDEKLQYDVEYVRHISLGLDLSIIWETIRNVSRGKDINMVPTGQFLDDERRSNHVQM